jgi:hypothetical protein
MALGGFAMQPIKKKEIIAKMEQLEKGQRLGFILSATFGSRTVVVEHNPEHPGKKQKKYLLRIGQDAEYALRENPLMADDKPKKIAEWIAERAPQWLQQTPPRQHAA